MFASRFAMLLGLFASLFFVSYSVARGEGTFIGCQDENRNIEIGGPAGRVLADFCLTSDTSRAGKCAPISKMTVEHCVASCRSRGFAYAALQYADWCFCGNSLGAARPSRACTMACPGNASQICGGIYGNSVYSTGVGTPPGPGPSTVPTPTRAGICGCFDIKQLAKMGTDQYPFRAINDCPVPISYTYEICKRTSGGVVCEHKSGYLSAKSSDQTTDISGGREARLLRHCNGRGECCSN